MNIGNNHLIYILLARTGWTLDAIKVNRYLLCYKKNVNFSCYITNFVFFLIGNIHLKLEREKEGIASTVARSSPNQRVPIDW